MPDTHTPAIRNALSTLLVTPHAPPFPFSPPDHVRVIDEINFGNGLPEMRTWKQAEDAGKAVGFELVTR